MVGPFSPTARSLPSMTSNPAVSRARSHPGRSGYILERDAVHQVLFEGPVPAVAGIEPVRHAHFLAPEKGPGFQHAVDLGERARLIRRMARGFDRVAPVERVVGDCAHVHEAAREVVDHVAHPRLGVQRSRPVELDFAAIDSDHPDAGLPDDAAHRAADPTTDIDHRHALAQLQLGRSSAADDGPWSPPGSRWATAARSGGNRPNHTP